MGSSDRYTPDKRSEVMATVKKENTRLEQRFFRLLEQEGLANFSTHPRHLPGQPDVVFDEHHAVIFLDSCYWHACPDHLRMPISNTEYWHKKMARNRERDRRQTEELAALGWRVLRVWEHDLRDSSAVVRRVREFLGLSPSTEAD